MAGGECEYCSGRVEPVEQMIDRVSQRVLDEGGRVEVVAGPAAARLAKLGSIAPGKWADIVAVGGDPLTDIEALADIYLVIADGQVLFDRLGDVRRPGAVVALATGADTTF